MATITATKSGNWSDTTVWDLGRAPVDGDLVQAVSYVIDFDVDINQPSTVLNATSGYFRYNGGATRNVTANANLGTHSTAGLIQNSAVGTLNFYGIVVGGSGSNAYGAINNAAGTITVTTATGGSGSNAYGAINNAAGTITVTTATGGSGNNAYGAINNAAGTMTVTTATGGSGSGAYGVFNSAAGTITVTTATGGSGSYAYGAINNAAGTITVTTATGGSGSYAYGAINNAAGTMTVDLAVGNDYGPGGTHPYPAPGVSANNTVGQITQVKRVRFGAHGQSPIMGAVQMVVDASNEGVFVTNYSGGTRTLTPSGASAQFPATSDVRSGVSYDNGDKIGACAVPAASNVAVGIAVGNTTGTAVLTVAGVRTAVGLASANLDTQLAAIGIDPAAIRTAVGMASANLDTQISAVKAAIVSPAIVL